MITSNRGRKAAPTRHLFGLGHIVATPGALHACDDAGIAPVVLVTRHATGDWGDVCKADARENVYAICHGFRVFSAYTLVTGVRVWVITEADRSSTCLLLPSEY